MVIQPPGEKIEDESMDKLEGLEVIERNGVMRVTEKIMKDGNIGDTKKKSTRTRRAENMRKVRAGIKKMNNDR